MPSASSPHQVIAPWMNQIAGILRSSSYMSNCMRPLSQLLSINKCLKLLNWHDTLGFGLGMPKEFSLQLLEWWLGIWNFAAPSIRQSMTKTDLVSAIKRYWLAWRMASVLFPIKLCSKICMIDGLEFGHGFHQKLSAHWSTTLCHLT